MWDEVRQFLECVGRQVIRDTECLLGSPGGQLIGETASGDIETEADDRALHTIEREFRTGPFPFTLFDEKHGRWRDLCERPRIACIVDELDGSRPFAMGLRTCCTSLAALPVGSPATVGDVRVGVIVTYDGEMWSFVRDEGIYRNGILWTPPARAATHLADARLCFETVNSASLPLLGVLLGAFEAQVWNGLLSLASSAYVATKIVEGSCHAHLHLGRLLYDEFPEFRAEMRRVYPNGPCGQMGYDVAASLPLLLQTGCVSTDGHGRGLRSRRLDDPTPFTQITACDADLYHEILMVIRERLDRMRERLPALREALGDLPPSAVRVPNP